MHDQYNDKSLATLKKLSTIFELPEFVKQASVVDEKELHSLPRSAFGDPANRKFPIASKKDTYLSSLYFRKNASEYKDPEYAEVVKKNLDEALDLWGLPHTFAKKKVVMNKIAGITDSVNICGDKGEVLDTWTLNSPRDFEKAAIQLFENKNMFSFDQRKDIARQLIGSELKKEASLKEDVDTYLDKAAGFGMCTKLQLIDVLRDRARMYKKADSRFMEELTTYAESLENIELDHTHLEKSASIIDFLDKQTGIDKYRDLPSPEESIFVYTEKIAREIKKGFVSLQNGSDIAKTAIEESNLDEFFDKFIGEIPKVAFEEKLDILSSLPSPDADDFEQYYLNK